MGKRRNPKSASTSSEEGEDREAESGDEEGELDSDEEGEVRRRESSGSEDRRVGGRLASSLLDRLRMARLGAMSRQPSSNSTSWL